MIGQIRTRKSPPQDLLHDWKQRHGDNRLKSAFHALPLVSDERLDALTSFFAMLVDYLVSNHLVSLQGDSCIVAAIEYMEAHLHEPLTLDEVASQVNRSRFSVSHAFRKHLQATFKHILIELKLSRADEYFAQDPSVTVAEVAYRLGYDDAFYFSRLYRKHRGEPPSHVLKRLRADTGP